LTAVENLAKSPDHREENALPGAAGPQKEPQMKSVTVLPAGIRLDAWPQTSTPEPLPDAPEVAALREELRKSMPQVAAMLEMLAKLRPIHELTGRLGAPHPAQLVTFKR
jgi:hypothetical protein